MSPATLSRQVHVSASEAERDLEDLKAFPEGAEERETTGVALMPATLDVLARLSPNAAARVARLRGREGA